MSYVYVACKRCLDLGALGKIKFSSTVSHRQSSGASGEIVRVQYFVRGGFVGHRSRASSKHLSSLIFRSTVFDSSGVKKGLRCSCKIHVWVSGPTKMPIAVDVRRSDVTMIFLPWPSLNEIYIEKIYENIKNEGNRESQRAAAEADIIEENL
ncbi:hypothetical protein TNCV_639501 [Trichonephila clavipes]|nr:hypothetical protein TNCV_639501 [Trichonephila clavipes]